MQDAASIKAFLNCLFSFLPKNSGLLELGKAKTHWAEAWSLEGVTTSPSNLRNIPFLVTTLDMWQDSTSQWRSSSRALSIHYHTKNHTTDDVSLLFFST